MYHNAGTTAKQQVSLFHCFTICCVHKSKRRLILSVKSDLKNNISWFGSSWKRFILYFIYIKKCIHYKMSVQYIFLFIPLQTHVCNIQFNIFISDLTFISNYLYRLIPLYTFTSTYNTSLHIYLSYSVYANQ